VIDNSRFLDLLNIDRKKAVEVIADLASNLTGDDHTVRSIIIDLHFTIELEFRRLLYHILRGTILYIDESDRAAKADVLNKAVGKVPIGTILMLLEAIVKLSPWPDLQSAWDLNSTRNKLSHRPDTAEVTYKGRCPFTDRDCLAEIYFDVWAMKQTFSKLFDRVVEGPLYQTRYYFQVSQIYEKKFGTLDSSELPKLSDYPEW
jgi:hypothetical protein